MTCSRLNVKPDGMAGSRILFQIWFPASRWRLVSRDPLGAGPPRLCDESLLLQEDGGPLRNQAEEEEHSLHLRGAASNPKLLILVGELEIDVGRTDGLQRSHGPARGRRRHDRVLRALNDQRRQ